MIKFILLAAGGAVGTLLRYLLSGFIYKIFDGPFPWGTLCVNLTGSFLIGLLWGLWEIENVHHQIRNFVFIGILGGFTTFSTYTLESLSLFRDGEIKLAVSNIITNNFFGIALVLGGILIAKHIINFIR